MIVSERSCRTRWGLFGLALWFACTAGSQPAPVPDLVNYQGTVYLESGSSSVDGAFAVHFRLYDAATEGTLLWGESLNDVNLVSGHFNVVLGNGLPIDGAPHGPLSDVFKHSQVYIEIAVGSDDPIRVRQRFVSAPYALAVQHAESAVHGVPPGTVAPFAGGDVPYGWLPCDGLERSKSEYPALYAALCDNGICIWGESVSGFSVPNLGGRAVAGAADPLSPGTRRGAETHTLTVSEMPGHAHSYRDKHWDGTTQSVGNDDNDRPIADDSSGSTARTTATEGDGGAHNEIQPSAVVNFIIKY